MSLIKKIIAVFIQFRRIDNEAVTGWACICLKKRFFFLRAPVTIGEENERMKMYTISLSSYTFCLMVSEYDSVQYYYSASTNSSIPFKWNKNGVALGKHIVTWIAEK